MSKETNVTVNVVPPDQPAKMGPKYIVRLTVVLFLITAIAACLLGLVNAVTKDEIARQATVKTENAMAMVLPLAKSFEDISYEPQEGGAVTSVLLGMDGETPAGFAVQVSPMGFGGAIDMVVGLDMELNVTAVSIVSMSETAGLGSKAKSEAWFLEQFTGKTDVTLGADIDAITGATVTSRAVTDGVQAAIDAVGDYMEQLMTSAASSYFGGGSQ